MWATDQRRLKKQNLKIIGTFKKTSSQFFFSRSSKMRICELNQSKEEQDKKKYQEKKKWKSRSE